MRIELRHFLVLPLDFNGESTSLEARLLASRPKIGVLLPVVHPNRGIATRDQDGIRVDHARVAGDTSHMESRASKHVATQSFSMPKIAPRPVKRASRSDL